MRNTSDTASPLRPRPERPMCRQNSRAWCRVLPMGRYTPRPTAQDRYAMKFADFEGGVVGISNTLRIWAKRVKATLIKVHH